MSIESKNNLVTVSQASLSESDRALVLQAELASHSAYAPYSNFHVGAAIRAVDGTIILGCNVENISYGVTVCAEVGAVSAAVQQRKLPIEAIAIYGRLGGRDTSPPRQSRPLLPCGRCRQILAEMTMASGQTMRILCSDSARKSAIVGTAADFLPGGLDDGLVDSLHPAKVA